MVLKRKNKLTAFILIIALLFTIAADTIIFSTNVYAAGLSVTTGHTKEELVAKILGEGVTASNISITGAGDAFGIFSGGQDIIGIEEGIILSTGNATGVVGTNNSDTLGTNHNGAGDPDLKALLADGIDSHDAAVLEFDFVPQSDHISFQYVFSSEEYNEYANDTFNDTFAFFLDGTNIAIIPGTNTAVSINTVNGGNPYGTGAQHPEYYINNDTTDGGGSINTQMDGLTVVMSVSTEVTPGEQHHIKLAISDGGDGTYDSNVFIKANSINDRAVQPGDISIESREEFNVKLLRNNGSDGTIAVDWKAKDIGGNIVGSGTATFNDSETEKIITVPETTDTIELSNVTGGGTITVGNESVTFEEIQAADNIPPDQPSAPDLSAGSDTGLSSADNITTDTTPTLGGAAEADSIVTLTSSLDGNLGTATADGTGNWTITTGVLTAGTHNITATATDAAGNTSAQSTALAVTIDTEQPAGYSVVLEDVNENNETSATIKLSNSEVGDKYNYTISSSGGGNSITGNGTIGSETQQVSNINLSLLSDGILTLDVYLTDKAGNQGESVTDTANKDTQKPSAEITTEEIGPTNTVPIPVTVLFSESVTGFGLDDIQVTNGTVDNLSGSGTTYSADITPNGDGQVTVDIEASSAQDLAGNNNEAAVQLSIEYDGTPPQVSGLEDGNIYNSDVTPEFNEGTAQLNGAEFLSGTAVTVEGIYTLIVTDESGNETTLVFEIDKTAPDVTLHHNHPDSLVKSGDKVIITAEFSEVMTEANVKISNTSVDNGIMTDTGNGKEWTYEWNVPSTNGEAVVTVAGNDRGKNSYSGSENLIFVIDNSGPTVALSHTNDGNIVKQGDKVTIKAVFNEIMVAPTINIDNGNVTNALMTGNNTTWAYEWTVPDGNAFAEVTVKGTDEVGNAYNGNNSLGFNIDNTKPQIADIQLNPDIWTNENVEIIPIITDESDIAVTKYVYGNENASQGINFSGKFTVIENNIYTIYTEDEAGNHNERTFQVDIIDKDKPLIEDINLTPNTWTNGNVDISFTTNDGLGSKVTVSKYVYGERNSDFFELNGIDLEENLFTVADNGKYTIFIEDAAGNNNIEVIEVDNIDKIKPSKPEIYRIPDQDFYNDEYTIRIVSGSDNESTVSKTVYRMTGALNTDWSPYTDEINILNEGTITIQSKTIDIAGNESEIDEAVICIDKELYVFPSIIVNPDEEYSNADYTVSIDVDFSDQSVTDAVYSSVYYKTSNMLDFDIYDNPFIISREGNTDITVKVMDRAGNVRTLTKSVFLDKTKPVVSGVTSGVTYKEYKTITFNEGEATLNALSFESGTTINVNGDYTLIVTDDVGNVTKVIFTIDNDEEWVDKDKQSLEIEFADGDSRLWVTKDLILDTLGANGSIITWKSSNENIISTNGKVTHPKDEDSLITLTATIKNGEVSKTKEFNVKVISDIVPPSLALIGDEEITLQKGQLYVEKGVTAIDNIDGDITDKVEMTGVVDTDIIGTYIKTYSVEDSTGNKSTVKRKIIVKAKEVSADAVVDAQDDEKIPDNEISKAVDAAQKDNTNEIKIVVNKEVTKENSVEVSISKDEAEKAKNKNINLTFETENTTIKVPMNAVDTSSMSTTSRLEMVVEQVDTEAEENKEIVDAVKNINENVGIYKNKIYDFKMKIVEEDEEGNVVKDEEIENFTSQEDISLKIVVGQDDEGDTRFMSFYYNEDRGEWEFIRGQFDEETGEMILLTNHLSIYSVMSLTKEEKQKEMVKVINKETVTLREVLNVIEDKDMELHEEAVDKYNDFTNTHKNDVAQNILDNKPDAGYNYNTFKEEHNNVVTQKYNSIDNDETAPEIELVGNTTTIVKLNHEYVEQGAIATDNIDGNITGRIVVTGDVNISVAGEYLLKYTVADLKGNTNSVTRTVIVRTPNTKNNNSIYTQKALDNNIKIIKGEEKIKVSLIETKDIIPKNNNMKLISSIYKIDNAGKEEDINYLLNISYDEVEGLNEEKLAVFIYDEQKQAWKCIGGIVDKENNKILVSINRHGKIAVMENFKSFKDIQGHWAQGIIQTLASRQIIDGDGTGNFNPNTGVTRAEFATLIARIFDLELENPNTGFKDIKSNDWYAPYIAAARKAGVVKGVSETRYEPDRIVNREEMTAIVLRAYSKVKELELSNDTAMTKFNDNNQISDWAYRYVYTAKKLNLVKGRSGGNFVPKDPTLRGEAAALIYRLLEQMDKI